MAMTGHGTTLTWSGFSGSLTSIAVGDYSRPKRETSHLGTTEFATSAPGDLVEPPEVTVSFYYVGVAPSFGEPATATITYSDDSTLAGTAYLVSWSPGEATTNENVLGTLVFQFDGETGPAISAGA